MTRPSNPHSPPRAWLKLLHDHSRRVTHLRLLWRRGKRPYLPLIPLEDRPTDIYREPSEFWKANESPATHIEVKFTPKMSADARARMIDEKVGQLWACGVDWARALGGWCDFALVGYDKHGNVEFQNGKRCDLSPEGRLASEGGGTPTSTQTDRAPATGAIEILVGKLDRAPATGAIEILVGKYVFRVWDRDALRVVVDVLTAEGSDAPF